MDKLNKESPEFIPNLIETPSAGEIAGLSVSPVPTRLKHKVIASGKNWSIDLDAPNRIGIATKQGHVVIVAVKKARPGGSKSGKGANQIRVIKGHSQKRSPHKKGDRP